MGLKNQEDDILITNIQRCSFQDGPGIRTTVFFKGCGIKCPWCCNPENISSRIQVYEKNGIRGIYGRYYGEKELLEELLKDADFFGKYEQDKICLNADDLNWIDGGITLSGGEPLLQIDKIINVLDGLKRFEIHTAIETSLFASTAKLNVAIENVCLFLVDFKLLENDRCKNYMNGDLDIFLTNLDYLCTKKKIIVRIPIIGGYTAVDSNIREIAKVLSFYSSSIIKVELLKEHHLGISKYGSLKAVDDEIIIPRLHGVNDEILERYREQISTVMRDHIPVELRRI